MDVQPEVLGEGAFEKSTSTEGIEMKTRSSPAYHVFIVFCGDGTDKIKAQQFASVNSMCESREGGATIHACFMTLGPNIGEGTAPMVMDAMQQRCDDDRYVIEGRGNLFHYLGLVENRGSAFVNALDWIARKNYVGAAADDETFVVYYEVARRELLDDSLVYRFERMRDVGRLQTLDPFGLGHHIYHTHLVVEFLKQNQATVIFDRCAVSDAYCARGLFGGNPLATADTVT